jgi:putative SbcD/Mre11-related phosphoesterase
MLHRHQLAPGLFLDSRRAVWLERESVLAVADLHLGYVWAQRAEGNLLPLSAPDDALARFAALLHEYQPREVVVLGDIVHRAVSLEPIREELRQLCRLCSKLPDTRLQLLAGNHDRALAVLLRECEIALPLTPNARIGPHVFLHGDRPSAEGAPGEGGRVFMGHEHPAISLGDGVKGLKCPCFLVADDLIVLPAFSTWAAGSEVRGGQFMSALAQRARFTQAVAIMGERLLPVPLRPRSTPGTARA